MNKPSSPNPTRRRVFAAAGSAGALAAAAVVLPRLQSPAAEAPPADPGAAPDGRYQETQHVLHYYRTARV